MLLLGLSLGPRHGLLVSQLKLPSLHICITSVHFCSVFNLSQHSVSLAPLYATRPTLIFEEKAYKSLFSVCMTLFMESTLHPTIAVYFFLIHCPLFSEINSNITQCAVYFRLFFTLRGAHDILGHKEGQVMRIRGRQAEVSYRIMYIQTGTQRHRNITTPLRGSYNAVDSPLRQTS